MESLEAERLPTPPKEDPPEYFSMTAGLLTADHIMGLVGEKIIAKELEGVKRPYASRRGF